VQLPPQPLATTGTAVQAAALYGMGLAAMGALFLIAGTRRPRNG
jgi:hypothetical protein